MLRLDKILESLDNKEMKKLNKLIDEIEVLEDSTKKLSDEQLRDKTVEFKERLNSRETLDDILIEAFAVVREASKRVLNMRQYRVQLMGGIVIHQGKIGQMKTGEGKTLTGVAPIYLNALTGKGVHVITVNSYLAKRDKEMMQPLYEFLGLTVGLISSNQTQEDKKTQYSYDITYGTNDEFGFDYLRDNLSINSKGVVQRELNFAIIDEVDSILIDEARTPLIISTQIQEDKKNYYLANLFVKFLVRGDYTIDNEYKIATLTGRGIKRAEKFYKIEDLMTEENMYLYHYINKALQAFFLMKRDVHYVVKDNSVQIVDEFTGRIMDGRRFSDGLHQAIEAKEEVEIQNESKTLATITYQNFFRKYNKISGMTGTAKSEEQEFISTYNIPVVEIPTNKPVIRKDLQDKVYKTEKEKFVAIADEIEEIHKTGQPILVGTASVRKSEILSMMLSKRDIKHNILNAKNHQEEASIIEQAGQLNSVTIATNMAGRGTDIKLGNNDTNGNKVKELGGLYVIGTERHENKRIDDQLRGRAGRQGDPGVSVFYVSMQDEIMEEFVDNKIEKIMSKTEEMQQLNSKKVYSLVDKAQRIQESRNFEIRKNMLKYDNIMDIQREVMYKDRKNILIKEQVSDEIKQMIEDEIKYEVERYLEHKDLSKYIQNINDIFNIDKYSIDIKIDSKKAKSIEEVTMKSISKMYDIQSKRITNLDVVEKSSLLMMVDKNWIKYMEELEHMRKGIGLVAIGQKDPEKEFISQSHELFNNFSRHIRLDTIQYIFSI